MFMDRELDPGYPHFWVLVTPQAMIGPFYREEAARTWAKDNNLDPKWVERVYHTEAFLKQRDCPLKEADKNGRH